MLINVSMSTSMSPPYVYVDKRQHVYLWCPTSNQNTKEIGKADLVRYKVSFVLDLTPFSSILTHSQSLTEAIQYTAN